jgi:hypothetical protein
MPKLPRVSGMMISPSSPWRASSSWQSLDHTYLARRTLSWLFQRKAELSGESSWP